MTVEVQSYLIEPGDIDWSDVLSTWSFLLPGDMSVWLVSLFADVFLVRPDGVVFKLDVGLGTLAKVAESREDFWTKAGQESVANDWLMIPLADELAKSGISLKPGQCYGFKTPPILGGQDAIKNCGALSFVDYIAGYGSIHSQLADVPDGDQVILKSDGDAP